MRSCAGSAREPVRERARDVDALDLGVRVKLAPPVSVERAVAGVDRVVEHDVDAGRVGVDRVREELRLADARERREDVARRSRCVS